MAPKIGEERIEQAARLLSDEKAFTAAIEEMKAKQPVILAYLFSEGFDVLSSDERSFMLYLTIVVWKAIDLNGEPSDMVSEEQLSQAEDDNWDLLSSVKSKKFRERLDVFFDNHPQEELLAFLEDALNSEEEDEMLTAESREPIFVSVKSVIDCLT
ncbi:MAG: hypothetical protein R3350_03125 [Saprospiraceae bacterium]|nr:hypothetical protein [Saprospiraceae bacterium]